ncbi:hypothetical protein DXG03_001723 [Asterophora parasitica]|uniref:Asl1-like glycosyl hydrolase catalytic domain-containing protein n=1 Tax=Asterophora parasitica TaxID=117018 RepID=A0A9P7GCD8_9AGAR|nr:hypothetical protein DXG03_001723 [Asterophora parasitica]
MAKSLQALLVISLGSQALAASHIHAHGFWANRLNHRKLLAHHPHIPSSSPAASHGTPVDHTTVLASSSTPTSRFVTSIISAPLAFETNSFDSSVSSETQVPGSVDITDTSAVTIPTTKSSSPLTPNGIKAGIAGGDAYPYFKDHIGWWYDWSPNPSKAGKPIAVPMLWGAGTADSTDAARLAAFKKISAAPPYVLGYEEPDCPPGSGSAGMSVAAGVSNWQNLIVPLGKKGALLGSPSMCKQADEDWLKQFKSKISTQWDFTAIHINKNSLEGVKKDIDYYWNTYKKPIWVTEFACVNDKNGFVPCTNQAEINAFINMIVPYLEAHEHVYAYAYSNGLGLGNVWPLMKGGVLSASGKTYLAAVSKFH